MTWPNGHVDPRHVGRAYTHITLEGAGERVFDGELELELRDLLVLNRPDGDHHFVVVDTRKVIVDSPRTVGDVALYSTYVFFVRCEAIPEPMHADDAPLSHPPTKVRKTKEKP